MFSPPLSIRTWVLISRAFVYAVPARAPAVVSLPGASAAAALPLGMPEGALWVLVVLASVWACQLWPVHGYMS